MVERTFQAAPEPVACPHLGLLEDDRTRFLFATPAHRCHVKRKPGLVDLQHQGRYCLSNEFPACPRFRAPAMDPATAARRVTLHERPMISVVETSRPAADVLAPDTTARGSPVPSILTPVSASERPKAGPWDVSLETGPRRSLRRLVMVLILALAALAFAIIGFTLGILPSVALSAVGNIAS